MNKLSQQRQIDITEHIVAYRDAVLAEMAAIKIKTEALEALKQIIRICELEHAIEIIVQTPKQAFKLSIDSDQKINDGKVYRVREIDIYKNFDADEVREINKVIRHAKET